MRIATMIGTGVEGEDILMKEPWLYRLTPNHKIFTISRVDFPSHYNKMMEKYIGINVYNKIVNSLESLKTISEEFININNSDELKLNYNRDEIKKEEEWLGLSFRYIGTIDRRFYNNDKSFDIRNIIQLENYITGLVKLIRNFFSRNQVDAYINTLEDSTLSTVIYHVSKKMNIRVLGMMPSRFPESGIMFCDDFTDVIIWNNHSDWNEIITKYNKDNISVSRIMDKNFFNWTFKSTLDNIKNFQNLVDGKKIRKSLCLKIPSEKLFINQNNEIDEFKEYIIKIIRRNLIKINSQKPSTEKHYIFFPFHFCDDAQITFREPFVNQYSLIKMISRALPSGYELYVKPHPHYYGTDLSFIKLKNILKIENVRLIDPSYPSKKLITDSDGVITINSTTGFEAMVLGKPVISLGHDFYCKQNICTIIRDHLELPEAVMNMIYAKDQPNREDVIRFIIKVYASTIQTEGKVYPPNVFYLTDNDADRIAYALNIILNINKNI